MRFLASLIVLHAAMANADTPAQLAKRLVDFAHTACVYMVAHAPSEDSAHASEPRLASHFGRVVKTLDDGDGRHGYVLAVPQLAGWRVEFHARKLSFTIPADAHLTLKEFAKLLGTPEEQSDDMQLKTRADYAHSDAGPRPKEMDFVRPHDWPRCFLDAEIDGLGDDVLEQRVLRFDVLR
jgi:hypothetical protein